MFTKDMTRTQTNEWIVTNYRDVIIGKFRHLDTAKHFASLQIGREVWTAAGEPVR